VSQHHYDDSRDNVTTPLSTIQDQRFFSAAF
jgi:hypothetical protein